MCPHTPNQEFFELKCTKIALTLLRSLRRSSTPLNRLERGIPPHSPVLSPSTSLASWVGAPSAWRAEGPKGPRAQSVSRRLRKQSSDWVQIWAYQEVH